MSAATVSNVRPDKTRKSALSPAALVAFKLAPAPIKTETASVLPSPAPRSRGVFPSPSRYSMSAFASTAAFSSATAPRHDSSSTLTSPDAVVPACARRGVLESRVASPTIA